MRAVSLIARTLGTAIVLVAVAAGVIFGAIQTGPGKALLARIAGSLASGGGLVVSLSEVGGFVPSDLTVGRIELSDPDGVFARVEGLQLQWSPFALLSGLIHAQRLDAAKVEVLRRPNLPGTRQDASGSRGLPMVRLVLDRLGVNEITLAEPVAGHAAQLSFSAAVTLMEPARGLSVIFALDRIDMPGTIRGKVHYSPTDDGLEMDLQAQEPAGGLVARLLRLEGLPALDGQLRGTGPLDRWDGKLSVQAGAAVSGEANAWIRAEGPNRRVTFSADADLSRAIPTVYAPLLAGKTSLEGNASITPAYLIHLTRLTVRSAAGSAVVSGTIDAPAATGALRFDAILAGSKPFAGLAPGVGFSAARASGALVGALASPRIVATLSADNASGAGYGAREVRVQANATPTATALQWRLEGQLDGLSATDPKVAQALGTAGTLSLAGLLPQGGAPTLTAAAVALPPLDLSFTGAANPNAVTGTLMVSRLDLAALTPLAGRPLGGSATLKAQISTPAGGGFAADFTGDAKDVLTSDPVLDGLVGRTAQISGGLTYGQDGAVAVRALQIAAGGVDLNVNGRIDQAVADLTARLVLADLARLDSRLSGRLDGTAAFSGTLDALSAKARLSLASGTAMGRPVRDLVVDLTGTDLTKLPGAQMAAAGSIGGKALNGHAGLASAADGSRSLTNLDLTLGAARAQGHVTWAPSGLMGGQMQLTAPDLSDLSALALAEMSGALTATLTLDGDAGRQRIALKANATRLTAPGSRLERGDIDLTTTDPAQSVTLTGRAVLAGLETNGVRAERATLTATAAGAGATDLKLDALVDGTTLAAAGRFTAQPRAYGLRLETLRLAKAPSTLALSAPATFAYADGVMSVDRLALASGSGTAVLQGRAGEQLNLSLDLRNLPLSLAGLAVPTQGLTGTVSGSAQLSGPAAAPTGRYSLTVVRASQPDLQRSGVGPLDLKADGAFADGRVTVRSTLTGPSLSGVTVTGSAPLGDGALDLAVKGQVSLGIANAVLAVSGARAAGNAVIDATVKGTTANPSAGGTVRISGGRYDDALNGVTLDRIEATFTGTDRSVTLSSLTARTPNGGSVTSRGSVTLDPAAGFPGQGEITLQNAALVSSELMRLVADGRLTLGGTLASRPTVSGRIEVRNLDINIPDRLTSSGAQLNVRHVNVAPGTAPTLPRSAKANTARAKATRGARTARAQGPIVASLDLTISAANRVFVRGMGMDAELGGDLTVRGTSAEPVTVGGFQLRRGRFDVLGKRLDFSRGVVTFSGSTDPDLDFVAESTANDVTARIQVTGPASEPDILFTSTPTLPQDEVIARLLFGKATGQLSTGQALQVAQTVAQFSGGGFGAIDQVRRQLGVDSLDVGTNTEGTGGEVGFGKRINDNVYLGVRQGTTAGSSRATIDVDVTKNIRIQGGAGADGSGEVGIGAQWDY